MKPGKPFRITVEGANFSTESRIFIGDSDTPWPHAKLKSPTRLVLKGGDALDLQFPPGVEVQIRIESPDGQTAEVSLVR